MKMLPHLENLTEREWSWRRGALKLATGVAGAFLNDVDALGRLDCSLRESAKDLVTFLANTKIGDAAEGMPDYFYLSKLWVLGAYETARALEERLDTTHPCFSRVSSLAERLRRVRIPLAKLEAAKGYPADYNGVSTLNFDANDVSWQVSASESVSRNSLADEFLEVLACFPEPGPPVGAKPDNKDSKPDEVR